MPLFKRAPTPPPAPVQQTTPPRKRGNIFSSSRTDENATATASASNRSNVDGTTTGSGRRGGGFFRRRSTGSSDDVDSIHNSRRGSIGQGTPGPLGGRSRRGGRDRSLEPARYKVTLAEKAEKEADTLVIDRFMPKFRSFFAVHWKRPRRR
jgi:hypothetical protein